MIRDFLTLRRRRQQRARYKRFEQAQLVIRRHKEEELRRIEASKKDKI